MAESQTNKAWEEIFSHLELKSKILNLGYAHVSANDIKKYGNREPRLMCKFDDRESRPSLLKKNNLTILPLKNGEYVLVCCDGYKTLPSLSQHIEFLEWPFGNRFETLPREPRSESQVIDMAFATGLLTHFLEDDNLTLTIRGRLRSSPFEFYIQGSEKPFKFKADGVQVEVDAGYEGEKIYLIEAKMGERDDFHVRQLFYPLRMWYEEGVTKEVIPIFINYANDTISISQYEFEDFWDYSSIRLVKSTNYSFEHDPLQLSLESIITDVKAEKKEPDHVPFPQADDIRKVRDTIDLISWGYDTRDLIAEFWNVDKRQGDYYANAGCYLGFIEKHKGKWILTDQGKRFSTKPTTKRNKLLFESLLSHPVFFEAASHYLNNKDLPKHETICGLLQKYTDFEFSESTLKRRTRTIVSWLNYMTKTFEEIY